MSAANTARDGSVTPVTPASPASPALPTSPPLPPLPATPATPVTPASPASFVSPASAPVSPTARQTRPALTPAHVYTSAGRALAAVTGRSFDDLPADSRRIATPPTPMFDSPDPRPVPLPPGASQPNAPLGSPLPSLGAVPPPLVYRPQQPQQQQYPQQQYPQQQPQQYPQQQQGKHKFSLLRKKGRRNSNAAPPPSSPGLGTSPVDDDDDDWLLEGASTNGHVNATVSLGREASGLGEAEGSGSLLGSPSKRNGGEKRMSKSRALAKKTSRLFSRNGHHHEDPAAASATPATLSPTTAMRHNSISSNGSNDSRQKHWNLSRVSSRKGGGGNAGTASPPPDGQPSSWHPPSSFALRRTTSQITDRSDSTSTSPVPVPIAQFRDRSNSQLSTSVPVVIRHDSLSSSSTHPPSATASSTLLPSRMSSWFSNLIPTTSADPQPSPPEPTHQQQQQSQQPQQPPPQQQQPPQPPSPQRKAPGVAASIFTAARNKAVGGMRYLLDSEAQPDTCPDAMWVMGVAHPGYAPPPEELLTASSSSPGWAARLREGSSTSTSSPPPRGLGNLFGSSFNIAAMAREPSTPESKKEKPKEVPQWPEQFYDDFRTRVWCTYRSLYAPIIALPPGTLLPTPESYYGAFTGSMSSGNLPQPGQTSIGAQPSRLSNGPWGWVKGDERGLTSDAGWGCMLRTGQSLLANALIHLHLGRGWRLPAVKPGTNPESTLEVAELEAYATYVRILSWFFDDPSPLCPFSVHRMALIGKELGKEVGEWFGPSTASGALKTLVNSFPLCGLSVVNAVDGTIYRSDVYAASSMSSEGWYTEEKDSARSASRSGTGWGGKAVLILVGIRLGLDGVNPIYYDSIKTLFTFPQSVGIAGGRPSSSYYFVASQANSLFYLDPHFTRPAIPLRVPPAAVAVPAGTAPRAGSIFSRDSISLNDEHDAEEEEEIESVEAGSVTSHTSGSSAAPAPDVRRGSASESPFAKLQSQSAKARRRLTLTRGLRIRPGTPPPRKGSVASTASAAPATPTLKSPARRASAASPSLGSSPLPSPARPAATRHSAASSASSFRQPRVPVDAQTAWYASAYSDANLRTFHCDRVKKLPLSGLDPSMLLGFLCTSEAEFDDFCDRVARLPHKIFAVADEPPMWSEDEDGLESVSEPVSDLDGSDSDRGDEDEDEILAPAPVAKGQGEFGHGLKRPLGPHRDDTITQLNAAAAGLALGSDADYEIDFDESRARKVSAASTVSQRRYVPRIVDTDTDTDDAVDIAADEADLPTPIATAAPALEAISHPVQPRARPARFAKAKRLPREIVDEYARVDAEPEREPEPKAKAKLRAESESAKAKPIDASSDDDVPPSVPPKSPVPRKEGDAVADADADAETDVEADPDMSFEDIGKPEALAATETEADADADADAEVELGSTPSSIPDLVEHPSPHRA